MSRSSTWSPPHADGRAETDSVITAADMGMQPKKSAARLGPLQTAAATAVIFTSLAGLAAMTGMFSWNNSDDASAVDTPSASQLRSAGEPVLELPASPLTTQPGIISETDPAPTGLRPMQSLAAENQLGPAVTGEVSTPATVPMVPAPPLAATAPPARPKRTVRRALAHHEPQQHNYPGKTREQVIEELMQAKRDGSYRALQENYR